VVGASAVWLVCRVLGSNVFNVLVGLGLPYFIVQAARGRPAVVRCQSPPCQSSAPRVCHQHRRASLCYRVGGTTTRARLRKCRPHTCLLRSVQVSTAALWPDVGCLLMGLAVFLVLVAAARLRLSRPVGWALLAAYAGYLAYEVLTAWVWDVYSSQGR
jgi:Ca2+/Na+ antiporter